MISKSNKKKNYLPNYAFHFAELPPPQQQKPVMEKLH
jgi:hypothetical protein